ncbi:threonine synthase [Paenibacillus athensensis]|uniref:Threonine synthase n=1 Tax=Paenibacillus athensensis TaxID=1967502 RepID=A0A4Y8PXD5_9BACL|nr:threonine synthase [Paenibacillus athensensis]MCD1260604.1 threonine synthase [Paenibacillus athensensis]
MKHFELLCARCSKRYPFRYTSMKCACGGTLLVEYDLEALAAKVSKEALGRRVTSMWRYREWLPVTDDSAIVSLGEGWTPLVRLAAAERTLPLGQLWVKREEQNPTGSFKARGFSVAVSLLKEAGALRAAVPSNGNAAGALAAYAAFAGIRASVFIPQDCPALIVRESVMYGADTYVVDGLIHDAGAIIEAGKAAEGWVNVGTMREPGRVEGKKTMGLELAEQFGWQLPSVIVYPTGGGSGIVGMWKAFRELQAMGWVSGPLPRLVSVQEAGCTPLVEALIGARAEGMAARGGSATQPGGASPTGMRVPSPPDLPLVADCLRHSGGTAVAVSRDAIARAQRSLGALGVSASPEGAATWAGLLELCDSGWIRQDDTVVLFNTSHALKYALPASSGEAPLIRSYADYVRLRGS